MTKPRTLVIGGGLSGIVSLKSSLERDPDEDVVLYERSDNVGGIWNYTGIETEEQVTCCKNTITNTSKEFFSFSDFLFPDSTPNYPRNSEIQAYIEDYRDHFKLHEKIIYNRTVEKVKPVPGCKSFQVISKDTNTGEEFHERFDYIYVCNGRYAKQKNVKFPGQDKFKGKIIHSRNFLDPNKYSKERVCVIGTGNTAFDIAVDLSKISKKVYVSSRSGTYVIKRCRVQGLPSDLSFFSRYSQKLQSFIPTSTMDKKAEQSCNSYFDHELYGLQPKHPFSKGITTFNDDLPNRIISGDITIKKNLERFTEKGVVFDNGEEVEIDTVIMATGYKFNTRFLDESIVKSNNKNIPLYHYMLLAERRNIAFIGYISPIWSVPPIVEMQARYIARVFKGDIELPSSETMKQRVQTADAIRKTKYQDTDKFIMHCRGLPYLDELATGIGCKPNIWRILSTDPSLAFSYCFEIISATQYRLVGPNAWTKARQSILDIRKRVESPFGIARARCRETQRTKTQNQIIYSSVSIIIFLLALLIKLIFM